MARDPTRAKKKRPDPALADWLFEMVLGNFLLWSKSPVGAQTLAVFLVVVMLQSTVQEYVQLIVRKGQCLDDWLLEMV